MLLYCGIYSSHRLADDWTPRLDAMESWSGSTGGDKEQVKDTLATVGPQYRTVNCHTQT